jgi:hypothetical protein
VEAHGGRLAATKVDTGSSFVVTLPSEPTGDAPDGPVDASWNLMKGPKEPDVV